MVASFFARTDRYVAIVLEEEETATADWFTKNCLPLVLEKVREKLPHSRIRLHYDNASPHTAIQITNYLWTLGIEILAHPPYGPDLISCDFYSFLKINEKLRRKWFTNIEKAVSFSASKKRPSKRFLSTSGKKISFSGFIECME
ncbi:Histone-lysine N-methyltransferase SETMAR [Eumeta japonica]|uniref:Histone-lysine N-methyltransferase SETMAR n=1 Tax=Eumeta variegata TaxID=151549 RepID=A0A4C1VWE4_EUMVA|nr:Histone-lysine N-methyltransferase SETMAR [Eumeta japonica]